MMNRKQRIQVAIRRLVELWQDEQAAIVTVELILTGTVLGIGAIVGLAAFRDSMSQEFGDVSAGLASVDHSYEYSDLAQSGSIDSMRFRFSVSGASYVDEANANEPAPLDPVGDSPVCMSITAAQIQDE